MPATSHGDRLDHGMQHTVIDNTAASRFELGVDGEVGSFAEYVVADGVMTFTHTVTVPHHRGKGLAAIVVRHGLDAARSANLRVVPRCWYVAEFIHEHPGYADLVLRAG